MIKKITRTVLGIAFLFLTILNVSNAATITYGEDIVANFDVEGQLDVYTFAGKAGDRIFIRMRDAESPVDACIKLYSPSGSLIGEDCGNGGIVVLKDIQLTEDGTYEIRCSDNNDNDVGAYGISLELLNSTDFATPISCGVDLNNVLDKAVQIKSYSVVAKAGEIGLFQMRSSNKSMESEIEVYDPQGNLLASKSSSHLARIKDFEFPVDGSYLVLLTDYNGNDQGEFGFSFQVVNRPECGERLLCGGGDLGTQGSFISDISKLAQVDAYYFSAEKGNSVVIQMYGKTKGFDTDMKLYNPQGEVIATTTPKYGLVRIEYNDFVENGHYMVIVGDNNGKDLSDYEIAIQRVDGGGCSTSIGCTGIQQEGNIEKLGGMTAYSFSSVAGTATKMAIFPDDQVGLDPRLEVFSPSGNKILDKMSWDAVYSGEVMLPEDGTYTVLVSDHNGNDLGNFMIEVEVPGMIDNEKPKIICSLSPYNAQLAGEEYEINAEDLIANVSDNCGSVTLTLGTSSLNCTNLGENQIEVIATDESGNVSTCMATLILHDLAGICPPEYCESKGYQSNFEWIESMALNDQLYVSNGNNGYYDFSDTPISLYRNVEYTMIVNPGLEGNQKRYFRIWIDWNRDGDFDDEGEFRGQARTRNQLTHTFTIPDYASDRAFRMRVAVKYGSYPESCEVFDFGEVEDYLIQVNEDVSCANLPQDWKGTDIGDTPIPGSVCYEEATNSYSVTGSGNDIDDDEDDFYFVFTELCGDGDIVAQVNSISGAAEYALGGIMFRQNLNEDSKYIGILASNDHGLMSQYRKSNGADTNAEKHTGDLPSWIKIERRDDEFTGFISTDGITWNEIFSYPFNMSDCMDVGLAVASNDATAGNSVLFKNVTVVPFDGAAGESEDRDTEEEIGVTLSSTKDLTISPNPAGDFVWVDCIDCLAKDITLSVYTMDGRLVLQNEIENASTKIYTDWSNKNLPNGNYFLSIKGADFVKTQKLMIAR